MPPKIKINPQFARLIQPPSVKEQTLLLQKLLASTEVPVIHTWQGSHLDGQYIYEICIHNDIPNEVTELSFKNWYNAASYICTKQLKRDSLTQEYRKYLIGQKFYFESLESDLSKQTDSKYRTAMKIARELYIACGTVLKYNAFSNAINEIFDHHPELAQRLLSGKTKISHANILELARCKPEEIKSIALSVINDNIEHINIAYIRNEASWSHVQKRAPLSRKERLEKNLADQAAIRKMPVYNPDAEVNSLCMTIDSWISSMNRVYNSDNFQRITNKASLQLIKKLSFLEHSINVIQESLVERNSL